MRWLIFSVPVLGSLPGYLWRPGLKASGDKWLCDAGVCAESTGYELRQRRW